MAIDQQHNVMSSEGIAFLASLMSVVAGTLQNSEDSIFDRVSAIKNALFVISANSARIKMDDLPEYDQQIIIQFCKDSGIAKMMNSG